MDNYSYEYIRNMLKKNTISELDIKRSKVFYFLKNKGFSDENIIFSKIESMCVKKKPDYLRIRSDRFLSKAKNKELALLIVGIRIFDKSYNKNNLGKNKILFFSSKSFFDYNKSSSNSNSFINFSINDLNKKICNSNQDNIIFFKKKNILYPIFVATSENIDDHTFSKFNEMIDKVSLNEKKISSKYMQKCFSEISEEKKEKIRKNFNYFCFFHKNKNFLCPCGDDININFMKENKIFYTHVHHLCPKSLFVEKIIDHNNMYLNDEIIHNDINLIPLCISCHLAIHKGTNNRSLVEKILNEILTIYKKENLFFEYCNFLKKSNINIKDLKIHYFGGIDEE